MPIKINYDGRDIASVDGGKKATLNCKGKLMEDNVLVDASEINEKDSDTLVGLIERTLTEIEDDRVKEVGAYVFNGNSKITSISFPNATKAGIYCCYGARNLTYANLPKATSVSAYCFADANLSYYDTIATVIHEKAFRNNANLRRLFLRRSDAICTLWNVDAFGGTPFAKTFGNVYVPRDFLASYPSATNWSGLLCLWNAIEDYTVDGTITGDIDWRLIDGAAIFTIDGNKYYNLVYTWEMWLEFEEPNGFKIVVENSVSYIKTSDGKYVYDNSGNKQTSNHWITDGGEYYTA